ncbi:P-loop NTPase fold protein [Achromobacter xylosoxidans]|uniref:P-loop NTPase fold protein n=1 Tax=Alcaligenes xylosoxydans xylosoxydans TaxID=85698 RepID=UPI000F4D7220|nr:P-loop NTPase fold protein [Achromobacter xylosoxidans]
MSENVLIYLNSGNQNQSVQSSARLIQHEAFDTLRQQICKDLIQANSISPKDDCQNSEDKLDLYPPGSGLTYFIDGTRGAGKSTFLDFTYRNLNRHGTSHGDALPVMPLLYLDPSRIESSEIVLLHILKHLKRLMEECPYRTQDWGRHQEKFRSLFKQMAGGLHLFVSSTDSLKDLDAELFLDYGLDRAADSQQLRNLLLKTIDHVCFAYKAKALLIAIDDADTKFSNAIEVLECIRKYLDTPQIVVLVTGDMEMYSLLVQNHFQQDFARHSQGFSNDRKIQQHRMVAHLEEQYLLKLFPIQRRVQLKTLHTLTARRKKNNHPDFTIKPPGDKPEMLLQKVVENIAVEGLRLRDRVDLDLFREHVLKLPVRSVLQLLSTYHQLVENVSVSSPDAAAEALRATTLSALYRYDIQVESIAEGDLHAVINAAFDLCKLDGEPDTAIYLRPQSRDATLRNAYVSLAADVARLCGNDPSKAISYMVSTAGSINILHLVTVKVLPKLGERGTDESAEEGALPLKVKQYLSVGRRDNALNWAFHANAALIGVSTNTGLQLRQGIIGVRTSNKGNAKAFDIQIRKALLLDSEEVEKIAPQCPAIVFSQSAVKRPSNTQRYLSIFNTLGLISNLLDLDVADSKGLSNKILKQLNKIQSVQTVSLPNWDDLVRDREPDIIVGSNGYDDRDYDGDDHSGLDRWVEKISDWLNMCNRLKGHFFPSAVLMGKIWNRLYFSLDNISASMRTQTYSKSRTSRSMELFAWALINSCLVEEVDYHYRGNEGLGESESGAINRYNPRTSGTVVIEKFKEFNENSPRKGLDVTARMAPLAFMIASCPLVLGLIRQGTSSKEFVENLNKKLKEFSGNKEISHEALCPPAVWAIVGETTISE